MFPTDILCWPSVTIEKILDKLEVRFCNPVKQGYQRSCLRHITHLIDILQDLELKESGCAATEIAVLKAYWQQKRLRRFLEPSDKAVQVYSIKGLLTQVQADCY